MSDPIAMPVVAPARATGAGLRRRPLLVAGSACLVLLESALAQRPAKVHRVGVALSAALRPRPSFLQGLRDLGYVEGQNLQLEVRSAEGRPERIAGHVEELVRSKVDVLVVGGTANARAAMKATSTIPIVFAAASDPVGGGLVTSLARPGGNITGFSLGYGDGFAGKWLDLLKQAVPAVSHLAALWDPQASAHAAITQELRAAATRSKLRLDEHSASNLGGLDEAIAAIAGGAARGLIVTASPLFLRHRNKLIAFAASRRLPAIYAQEEFTDDGGLMSYGPNVTDIYRRAASHVAKILEGAKPGDLPVEQPNTFEFIVNRQTARALGLIIPKTVLLRADRVIE